MSHVETTRKGHLKEKQPYISDRGNPPLFAKLCYTDLISMSID
jgi:hypothetical protein